jgi:ectoine hydroxylase
VLFYAYTYRWVRERDDLGFNDVRLVGLDPIRRQLLGAGTSAIGYWIPTDEDVPLKAAMR